MIPPPALKTPPGAWPQVQRMAHNTHATEPNEPGAQSDSRDTTNSQYPYIIA